MHRWKIIDTYQRFYVDCELCSDTHSSQLYPRCSWPIGKGLIRWIGRITRGSAPQYKPDGCQVAWGSTSLFLKMQWLQRLKPVAGCEIPAALLDLLWEKMFPIRKCNRENSQTLQFNKNWLATTAISFKIEFYLREAERVAPIPFGEGERGINQNRI
jgi:hypothetical protein